MKIIKPPSYDKTRNRYQTIDIFLAGGISNCSDWQEIVTQRALDKFQNKDFILINPRKDNFDVSNPSESENQIMWEHHWLELSDAIFFWFPKETLCPITLFELGCYADRSSYKDLIIGCDPEYKRLTDVQTQTKLRRPGQPVFIGFDKFLEQVDLYLERLNDEDRFQ